MVMATVVPAEGIVLERILEATWAVSRDGLSRQADARFDAAQRKTAWGRRHLRRFALMDGHEWLASATQCTLAGMLDRRPVRICGISAICTNPAAADGGHARELVDELLVQATRDGAEVALLFSADDSSEGEWPGFETIAAAELQLGLIESPRPGAPMTLIRGGEERDLQAIVAMGQVRASAFRFHLDRDVEFVQHAITRQRLLAGLGAPRARELHFFIAEEGITAAAYVVISITGNDWMIEECGDRDPSGARVGAMLQALVAREPVERRPSIRACLPPAFLPPQITLVSRSASPRTLKLKSLGSTTVRPRLSADEVLYWRSDML
jgi:hypothetical protein